MARPERALDPSAGPVEEFASQLRELRRQAGGIGYRRMAESCGYSVTTLSDAAGGRRLPALPVALAYVRACGGDPAGWEEKWRAAAASVARTGREGTGGTGPSEEGPPPYLGLASYQPQDAPRFFGRERLVAQIAGRLRDQGFLAVVGASGSGKSSLLRAGVVPALTGPEGPARAGYRLLRPGPCPLEGVVEGLTGLPLGGAGMLLAVDQFEELFTMCSDEQRGAVVDALLKAVAGGALVVVALRSDFYGHCARTPRLAEAVERATTLIGPMTGEELRCAITGPAALAGLSVERALVARILADVRGEPGALPMVSHALLETWRLRQGLQLTLAGYEAAGGVDASIARTAEGVYASLPARWQGPARQVLLRLISLGEGVEDTRRRVDLAELDLAGAPDVVERLTRARLVVMDGTTVELAHEALIRAWPRLQGWLTDDREALCRHRQLTDAAHLWVSLDRDPGALLRGTRLMLMRDWAAQPPDAGDGGTGALTGVEREYLAASAAAEAVSVERARRRARHLRLLATGLAGALLVAVSAGGLAVSQWRRVDAERRQALSRQFAVQARATAPTDPATAMELAVSAHRTAPTAEARGVLLSLASRRAYSRRLEQHDMARDVAFAPGGRTLAVATVDGRVTLWDVADAAREPVVLPTGRAGVRAVDWHPGGGLLACATNDGAVMVWDVARRAQVWLGRAHHGVLGDVAFSPDGTLLASVGEDRRVLLWQAGSGRQVGELPGFGGRNARAAFTADGRRLVSAGDDGSVVVWDVVRQVPLHELRTGLGELYAMALTPDGGRLAVSGADPAISVWDLGTWTRTGRLTGHSGPVRALAFAPDGTTLVSAADDRQVIVWDAARGTWSARLGGHTSQVYGVAVSPDGETLASAGRDRSALLWRRSQLPLTGMGGEIVELSISPDGRHLAASATEDRGSMVWDLSTGRTEAGYPVPGGTAAAPPAPPGPAPEGPYLVARTQSRTLLWSASPARLARELTGHQDRVLTAALDPTGTLVASGAFDRTLRLWRADSGALLDTVPQTSTPQRVLFTRDGAVVAAGRDGTVTFWDVARRSVRRVIRTAPDLSDASLSPDGRLLAVGDTRGRIRLWDVPTGRLVGDLRGHNGTVDALAFSPDGRLLASGGYDADVVLWDVATRGRWATLTGHADAVASAVWSPSGDRLYTGSVDRSVIAWHTRTPEALADLCRDSRAAFPGRPPAGC